MKFPLCINSHAHRVRTPSILTLLNSPRQNSNKYLLDLNGNLTLNMYLHQVVFDEFPCKSYINLSIETQKSNFLVHCSLKQSNYVKKQLYENTIPLCLDPRDRNFHLQHSLFQTRIILFDRIIITNFFTEYFQFSRRPLIFLGRLNC